MKLWKQDNNRTKQATQGGKTQKWVRKRKEVKEENKQDGMMTEDLFTEANK